MSKTINHCISCGLCCVYYPSINKNTFVGDQWAVVENDEIDKVPRKLYTITRKEPAIPLYVEKNANKFIKSKPDVIWRGFRRCVALEGVQTQEVKCNVYENRPRVCSDFVPGSSKCNEIREWGGLDKIDV